MQIPKDSAFGENVLVASSASSSDGQNLSLNVSQSSDEIEDIVETLSYPTKLPNFSPRIKGILTSGTKSQLMTIYSEMIKEAAQFYGAICPSDTTRAKVSLDAIGRTVTEKFPILVVSDGAKGWSFFNSKLSSTMRNARCRLKRKLSGPAGLATKSCKVPTLGVPAVVEQLKTELTQEEYKKHVSELKSECTKKKPDVDQLKRLIQATHINRRKWIDDAPSSDLRLASILEVYPCFMIYECLIEELKLLKGEGAVNKFEGIFLKLFLCVPQFNKTLQS